MKTPVALQRRLNLAFTLIELLVVIAIIGILAAMLFPAIGRAKIAAQKAAAKAEMNTLGSAIKSYESDYNGHLPAPGVPTGSQDVTYGYVTNTTVAGVTALANNRDIVAVLLNLEKYPDGTVTTNIGKAFNPRGLTPWNAKYANDKNSAGIGPDGNLRDPWGNQYVISLDTSLNERTRDNLYGRFRVSQDSAAKGFYGLSNTNTTNPATDSFELGGQYLIWSLGPDGQADPNAANSANGKANKGVNQDNVLGWQ